jgi:tryptophan synthase alpha chain
MSRIEKTFERLRSRGEKALIAYLMAGDPDLKRSEKLVLTLAESGADIVELGVPFSDPIADGPVIQRAGQRALRWHTSLGDVIALARKLRKKTQVPLILMTYVNPVSRFGEDRFIAAAVSAGIDGVILPDLPPEEGGDFIRRAGRGGLSVILLAAPTSSRSRLKMIARLTRGFVYYVSLTGITGARLAGASGVASRISEIRRLTGKPIAVGFGVSKPSEAASLARSADGVIVGSAIVKLIEKRMNGSGLLSGVGAFVKSLKKATVSGSRPARRSGRK